MMMMMMVIMVAAAVVMQNVVKCYNRGIHRGLQEYGCEVLDSAWFESGKAMASQFGSLRSKCQERIRHMRDYWGEGV